MKTNKSYLLFSQYLANGYWLVDLFFLLTVLGVFYALWLGSYPLFIPDEGRYSEVAREMVMSGDYITPRVNGVVFLDKPVFYYWLQALAIHLFGIKEWALRFFPALFGVLGCVVTYSTGRLLFDRRTGLISAAILAVAPLYFGSAHYANLDLEVAVFISSALLFFITAIQVKTKASVFFLYAAYLCTALAMLTKGLIGLAFPVMIMATWIILLRRWDVLKKLHLIRGGLLCCAIVLPWYILVQRANPEFLHYFFVTQQVTRFLSAAEFNNQTAAWFYLPIVLIGFFPWTIFLFQALFQPLRLVWQARHAHAVELFLLLWIALIFIFFSIPHSKIMSYILPIFPALALLTGHYLSSLWQTVKPKMAYGYITVFSFANLIVATLLFAELHFQWFELPPHFVPYLITIATILIVSAVVALLFVKEKIGLGLFVMGSVTSSLALLTLTAGAFHLNQDSAKPLALQLKTIIQPQDEVVTYFKYYQDLPIYLGKRITIVTHWDSPTIPYNDNWIRELWYGKSFQNTQDWLINEEKFWERWHSDKRLFVLLNANYLKQFKRRAKSYFFIAKHNNILLLSNKPTVLAFARITAEYPYLAGDESKNGHDSQHDNEGDGIR